MIFKYNLIILLSRFFAHSALAQDFSYSNENEELSSDDDADSNENFDSRNFNIFNPFKPITNPFIPNVGDVLGLTKVVHTNSGKVRGTASSSRSGRKFVHFRGIPYANTAKRFEAPEPQSGWSGTLDATKEAAQCPQNQMGNIVGQEDCLTLDIATHHVDHNVQSPVMVWIHGGLFHFGSARVFKPKYFMDEDIVLVAVNYRLSSLGFLNTEDGVIPGNMGLKDQAMALRWVKANIHHFGGASNKITIFGESAGSVSVHLHTLSPMTKNSHLFHRAIAMSGTALSPFGLIENPRQQVNELAMKLGCFHQNTRTMVSCMKQVPMQRIIGLDHKALFRHIKGDPSSLYGPTIDKESSEPFLPKHPMKYLESGDIAKVPVIMGVTSGEGLVYLIAVIRQNEIRNYVNTNFDKVVKLLFKSDSDDIGRKVKEFYLHNEPISDNNLHKAMDMMSDRGFYLDNHKVALMHSKVAPVFLYYFTYQGVFSQADLLFTSANMPFAGDMNYMFGSLATWLGNSFKAERSKNKLGVSHGDEVCLFFNIPFARKEIGENDPDINMSKKLVKLWVSFATRGHPDMAAAGEGWINWESVKATNPNLEDKPLTRLELGDRIQLHDEVFFDRIQFWKDFLPY